MVQGFFSCNHFVSRIKVVSKICRLATDKKYHGEGIGAMIVNMIIASYRNDNKAGETRLLYFDLESVKPHPQHSML